MTDETTPPNEPTEPEEVESQEALSEPEATLMTAEGDGPVVTPFLVTGTGTPPTSPNFGVPRYSANDVADFPTQGNAITDTFDAQAAKRGAIVDADIASGAAINRAKIGALNVVDADVAAGAAIQEAKLNLATDAAAATGSRRTLGPGAQQALPGTASSAVFASLVDLKPTLQAGNYSANPGDLVIINASAKNVTLPAAPAINGTQVGVIAAGYDVVVNRSGSDTIQPGGLTSTVKNGTSTVFSYSGGVWYALQSGGTGGGASGPVATTAARMYRNAALTVTASTWTKVPLDAIGYDTSGLASAAQGRINIAMSGYYQVDAGAAANAVSGSLQAAIYKNGSLVTTSATASPTAVLFAGTTQSDVIQCNAGDYLELWCWSSITGISNGFYVTYLAVALLASVPGAVGPVTPARVHKAGTQSLPATVYTKIALDTPDYDPGGNFSAASSRYVCPATGYYQVNTVVSLQTATTLQVGIYKNGALYSTSDNAPVGAGWPYCAVADILPCNAGDYIEIYAYPGAAATTLAQPSQTFMSVVQVGNLAATPASTACARASRAAAFTPGAAGWAKIPLDTLTYDTSGMVQITNGRIVCPVAGFYEVSGTVGAAATAATQTIAAGIAKNGAVVSQGAQVWSQAAENLAATETDIISCNAGDYLELWAYENVVLAANPNVCCLAVALLTPLSGTAGPNTAARAYRNAALTLTLNAWTKMPLDMVSFDPGANVNIASNRYVCPATGTYQVAASMEQQMAGAGQRLLCGIYKNGAQVGQGEQDAGAAGAYCSPAVSDLVSCNAGDYFELWYYSTSANGSGFQPGSTYLSVVQVGNSMNFTQAGGDLTGNYPHPTVAKVNGVTVPLTGAAWIAATLGSAWTNYGAPYENAGYMKDPLGFVHLRGLIIGGATGSSPFTLPAGYRPGAAGQFPCVVSSGAPGGGLTIAATGVITMALPTVGAAMAISGITFLAEN